MALPPVAERRFRPGGRGVAGRCSAWVESASMHVEMAGWRWLANA